MIAPTKAAAAGRAVARALGRPPVLALCGAALCAFVASLDPFEITRWRLPWVRLGPYGVTITKVVALVMPLLGALLVPFRALGPRPGRVAASVAVLALLVVGTCTGSETFVAYWESSVAVPDEPGLDPVWWLAALLVAGLASWTFVGFGRRGGGGRAWTVRRGVAAAGISAALFLAVLLARPLVVAARVASSGWSAENSFYGNLVTGLVADSRVCWTVLLVPDGLARVEGTWHARRDAAAGRVRFLGGGINGLGLSGIPEFTEDVGAAAAPGSLRAGRPAPDPPPEWACQVGLWRRGDGTLVRASRGFDDDGKGDGAGAGGDGAPRVDLAPGRYEIVCRNPAGAERRFAAEVTRMGCVTSADREFYNRAMLRALLGSGPATAPARPVPDGRRPGAAPYSTP